MADLAPTDLAVIIPTRQRWAVLARTLAGLEQQTVSGFETIVVVDGEDEDPADVGAAGVRVLVQRRAGPGAARNLGARATTRSIVLFLGDDIVPTPQFVERHLAQHRDDPALELAVLGQTEWHVEAGRDRIMRWLDRSDTQFAYRSIADHDDVGYGRFYSSNVSLKRELFLAAGGFDEEFTFDYEDLDLGWRLHQRGLRLRYEPRALGQHLHHYDWASLESRFAARARGERVMQAKHDWFDPYFASRIHHAAGSAPVSALWAVALGRLPARLDGTPLAGVVERRADRWFYRRLAPVFLEAWEGARDHEELRAYLGQAYEHQRLVDHRGEVDREEAAVGDASAFYRTSHAYLYDLTAFAMSATKAPYLPDLRRVVRRRGRVLDYGCGIGSDGLRLLEAGYQVAFADFDSPSTRYLRWRLQQRGFDAPVYDLDQDVPGGFDAAFAFDVIEHVEDPFAFLGQLERRADVVVVNLLEPDPDDTHLHHALPIDELLDHATRRGLLRYRIYHGRSHLVVYRGRPANAVGRARSRLQRHVGEWRRSATSPS